MVETRSQAQGKPLKKPGAYDTDRYFQEADQGYGDVGVDQEPDAGRVGDPSDPDFQANAEEMAAGEEVQAREDEAEIPTEDRATLKADLEDLKATRPTREPETDAAGEPVPVVQEDQEELEANEAGYTRAP